MRRTVIAGALPMAKLGRAQFARAAAATLALKPQARTLRPGF